MEYARLIGQGQTGPARVRLRKHLDRNPEDGQAWFLFGLSYHREKKYGEAAPHFARALAHAADYPPLHHFRGWCHYYLGELEASRQAFEMHLALDPFVSDSQFALGVIALDQDRIDDAEQHFTAALSTIKNDARANQQRSKTLARYAEVFQRRGEHDAAAGQLEEAVALFPDHYEAWYQLYRLRLRAGDDAAADAALKSYELARSRVRPDLDEK